MLEQYGYCNTLMQFRILQYIRAVRLYISAIRLPVFRNITHHAQTFMFTYSFIS